MLNFKERLQDARDESLRSSLILWLSQVDPNGDWEDVSLMEALSSARSILFDSL
jgi:hypothetical protein